MLRDGLQSSLQDSCPTVKNCVPAVNCRAFFVCPFRTKNVGNDKGLPINQSTDLCCLDDEIVEADV